MKAMIAMLRGLVRLVGWLLRALGPVALRAVCPPRCSGCDAPLRRVAVFCAPCATSLTPLAASRVLVTPCRVRISAVGGYGGALAEALRRLKYQDRPDLARPLGMLAAQAIGPHLGRPEIVVPVPLHPERLAERGYNQAALLAAVVASQLGVPLHARALQRRRRTRPQQGLDRRRRAANVAAAFTARVPAAIRSQRVLLVDDVVTTGATLAACAQALYEVGARQVDALVLASAQLEAAATAARPELRSRPGT